MRYPQVRYPIIRHYDRYNYSECVGHKWGEPTHYNAALSPPRYPMPAIQRCTMETTRAYGPNHGPYVFNITLWDADYIAYAQWSQTQGDDYGTYWQRH